MLTPSLQRSLCYQATVKSHPVSGNRPGPSLSFDIPLSPIDSADPYLNERTTLETPFKGRQAFTYTNNEIKSGMYLVFDNKEYAIVGVAPYPERDGYVFYQLFIQDIAK